ncbi:unnamed protein product [Heligmosomoides polygyrus]|uniref:Reverse transcriptase domain-containing protein n=1 Tax=Heligmosomoides polygyrus TaxID=6339 RepID=A0A183G7X0_HELPZ|nr:unnamed protein product [Heligmosomoides polygyrus]
MSVEAPQTGCPEHDKDKIYLTLEEAISRRGRIRVLQLPRDQTDLTHDEGLRTAGRPEEEESGHPIPGAFMPEISTTYAVFTARLVMKKYREKRKPATWHSWTWRKATTGYPAPCFGNPFVRGVSRSLISVIKDMYEGSKVVVRTPHEMTKKVDITLGILKGRF